MKILPRVPECSSHEVHRAPSNRRRTWYHNNKVCVCWCLHKHTHTHTHTHTHPNPTEGLTQAISLVGLGGPALGRRVHEAAERLLLPSGAMQTRPGPAEGLQSH